MSPVVRVKLRRLALIILALSILYVVAVSGWIATGNLSIIPVMEVLTIISAIVIVLLVAELYRASSEKIKVPALVALVLVSCMACVTIMNHFLYMTILNQIYGAENIPSWLTLYGWPSLSKGLECVAWGFFLGLAMLFLSSVFKDMGSKAMDWTMRVCGALTLAGLIGPLTGNMNFYNLSTIGYSVGLLVLSVEMIVYFKNRKKNIDVMP